MKRNRSQVESSGSWDPESLKPPSHPPREEVPAALLEDWYVSRKMHSSLKVERIVQPQPYKFVRIDIDYIVSGLVNTFANAFEQALKRKKALSRSYSNEDIADLKARAKDVMPGIVTRFLQLRLYNIAVAKEVILEGLPAKPTKIDLTIQLPTPLARAISCTGVFRPAGVVPEIAYFPTYFRNSAQLVGSAAHCKVQGYAKLFPEFAKCGITTTRVETRDSDGTSWYLLETEHTGGSFEFHHIIASFPPQCGNISATDAFTRSYCLHYDSRYPYPDARHKFRKHLYVGEDSVGSKFGIALDAVGCPKQPSAYMHVDMATKPQGVADKLLHKLEFFSMNGHIDISS